MSNINIMAHLGGFISGVLITLIGYYFKTQRSLFWSFLIVFYLYSSFYKLEYLL